jgi:hypothetical protein
MKIKRTLSLGLACLGALCVQDVQAAPSERIELCKGAPPARQDEMIIVDSAFRRLPGKSLQLGTVDFSVSRHVDGQFYIVAPLGARPASNLDGSEFHPAIDLLAKCGDKSVYGLSFDFDDSTLPPGAFAKPLAVYKDGSPPDDPRLAATAATVAGTIRRFWIAADLLPTPAGALELRLTNSGSVTSAPLGFAPLSDGLTIFHALGNSCQGRSLGAGESCAIAIAIPAPRPGANDEQLEWTVDTGPHSGLTLQFVRRDATLSVAARNR